MWMVDNNMVHIFSTLSCLDLILTKKQHSLERECRGCWTSSVLLVCLSALRSPKHVFSTHFSLASALTINMESI
jgi:hypothetical protein